MLVVLFLIWHLRSQISAPLGVSVGGFLFGSFNVSPLIEIHYFDSLWFLTLPRYFFIIINLLPYHISFFKVTSALL